MTSEVQPTATEDSGTQSSRPELSIILVSYNTRELTLEAIRSLRRETHSGLFELIVVDNASSDGSAEALAAEFPDIALRATDKNLGFATANNMAAEHARGRYLLLLNPDTVVLSNAVGRLLQFAKDHPSARLWGGRTLFGDQTLNPSSCWNRMTLWSVFCLMTGLKALLPKSRVFNSEAMGDWARDDVREVDIISGCFLLIEADLWKTLGGFNLDYFMYGEDADICLRARLAGARPLICPDAQIVHYGGASEKIRSDKMVRLLTAKITLMRHHWSTITRLPGYLVFWAFPLPRIIGYGLAMLLRKRTSDRENAQTWLRIWQSRADWLGGYPSLGQKSQ